MKQHLRKKDFRQPKPDEADRTRIKSYTLEEAENDHPTPEPPPEEEERKQK